MTREKELNVVSQKAFPGMDRANIRRAQYLGLGLDDKSWTSQPVCGPREPAPRHLRVAFVGLGWGENALL